MKKLLFIINSVSGKIALEDNLMQVVEILSGVGYEINLHFTRLDEDIVEYVEKNCGDYDMLVCCGGDGTLNLVSGAVYKSGKNVKIGYIPGGTTNDFAGTHRIDTVATGAAKQIATGIEREVDLGLLNGKPFIYVAAFGLFSDVSYQTDRGMKQSMGHAAYVFEGIKSVAKAKAYPMRVEYDDNVIEGNFIYGMISNSRRIGGFELPILQNILYDDGEMEVTLIRKPANAQETQKLINSLIYQNADDEMVYMFKTSALKIISAEEVPWSLDGEFGGTSFEADIKVESAALRMVF